MSKVWLRNFRAYLTDSLHAPQSIMAAKVEHAMSEVAASSISSFVRRPAITDNSWAVQHKIWLLLAEIYLEQDQLAAATNCLQEAINIFPLSHHIMFMVKNYFMFFSPSPLNLLFILRLPRKIHDTLIFGLNL